MGFFKKTKSESGWMAVGVQNEAVLAVHVRRVTDAMPQVTYAGAFPIALPATPEALGKIAKEIQADRYTWTLLLSGTEYQLLSVDAPNVPPDELKVAIRWRLKDMLDFHIDDATIDVLDVPVDKNAPVRNKTMYAVAAKNALIQERQLLFAGAKIPLQVIDIPEMAQRNIAALLETEGRGLAMLSFAHDGGLLTVTFNGELFLSRRIEMTLAQVKETSADQMGAFYDRITLELQRSLDHFDRQYHFVTLSKLVLAPMGAVAGGLKDYLASNLYVPVELLDLQSVLDLSKAPDLLSADAQARFFLTIGAALRLEEKVL